MSSFREAFYGSGATSDPVDAELMRDMVRLKPQSIPILAAGRCADAKSAFVDRGSTQSRESVDGVDESTDGFVERILPASFGMGGTAGYRLGVRFSGTMADTAELASQQPASDPAILRKASASFAGPHGTVEANPKCSRTDAGRGCIGIQCADGASLGLAVAAFVGEHWRV